MSKPTRVIVGLIHTLVLCLSVSSLITSFAAELRSAWQVEWDKAVKVAEEEGAVVIYMTQAFEPVFREAFQKKYPKIKVFFQAEGGIRFYKVTGVQTCALPI